MPKKKVPKGKMEVTIFKVSMEEYDKIVYRISILCALHGRNYHAKFIPSKVKPRVKK